MVDFIEKTFKLGKKVSIELEDTNGNTIGGVNLDTGKCFGAFSIADLDGDYLFDSENTLVRVQLDEFDNENKVEKAIRTALEVIPTEFHEEFLEMVNYCPQTVKSVQKNEEILLDDIVNR